MIIYAFIFIQPVIPKSESDEESINLNKMRFLAGARNDSGSPLNYKHKQSITSPLFGSHTFPPSRQRRIP